MPDPAPIRILLVEDHILLREALARSLAMEPDFTVAGQCAGVEQALELVRSTTIDVVLLDINLGSEQGGLFLTRSRAAGFYGKVIVVTAGVGNREAAWLLNRGCTGIFLKQDSPAELIRRIREVHNGSAPMDPVSVRAVVAQMKPSAAVPKPFTPRERAVLRGVCEGLSNKQIAERMIVSENSVKSFLQQIFEKTGVRTRAQLVAAAIEKYWDQLDEK